MLSSPTSLFPVFGCFQRKDADDELSELRKAVSDLESRSDDDRLIGQLQRKLTATKVQPTTSWTRNPRHLGGHSTEHAAISSFKAPNTPSCTRDVGFC